LDAEIKQMFGTILGKLDSMDSRLGSLENKVDSLENKVDFLDSKVTKNSLDIEFIQNDIRTIIEVQKAHMEQNERDHERIIKHIDEKTGLLESVLKRHSEEITSLKKKNG
jgi:chromosome segregation ATPase